jgi:CHAT domain-containing protein
LFSYLQLAKDSSGAEDGMLEAREILDLNLKADLAVLSACETGRGEFVSGEGVLGMSWAVLTAGTPTVVVSQWKVDSASTSQLMVAFHRTIAPAAARPGPIAGKAEALRKAQMELIRIPKYQHPFYWAGFEMLGDGY